MTAAGIGADLRARRLAVGLSQERLAVMAGTSAATVRRIEAGQIAPRETTLRAITAALAAAEAAADEAAHWVEVEDHHDAGIRWRTHRGKDWQRMDTGSRAPEWRDVSDERVPEGVWLAWERQTGRIGAVTETVMRRCADGSPRVTLIAEAGGKRWLQDDEGRTVPLAADESAEEATAECWPGEPR